MTITISPFTVEPNWGFKAPPSVYSKQENSGREQMSITYWKIYMDDNYVSYTSTKELAERTKAWMEKWLKVKA